MKCNTLLTTEHESHMRSVISKSDLIHNAFIYYCPRSICRLDSSFTTQKLTRSR
jgi:hypothetical protein